MATVTSSQITPITIEQGASFALQVTYKLAGVVVDMTGATVVAKIRRKFGDVSALVSFSFAQVGAASAGVFKLSLTAVQTAALTPEQPSSTDRDVALGHWDCEVTTADGVTRQLLYGPVKLRQWASS